VINLGNDQTVTLSEMILTIETVLGKKAEINRLPEQPGDVPQTWADITKAKKLFGYEPKTSFSEGIQLFVAWRNAHSTFKLSSSASAYAARGVRRWSARSTGPVGVTATGALWALKEQQPGDVPQTWADIRFAKQYFNYSPVITFKEGFEAFV